MTVSLMDPGLERRVGLAQPILILESDSNAYGGKARSNGAGPLRMRPDVSYWLPWQGQNQPPHSPRMSVGLLPRGMQPRCVQMPIRMIHWSWPGLTRDLSVCGS